MQKHAVHVLKICLSYLAELKTTNSRWQSYGNDSVVAPYPKVGRRLPEYRNHTLVTSNSK